MGFLAQQRSCRAWGFLCFALGSATHRARCLTSLSLKVSPGPPRLLQITSLRSQGSQVLLRVFEVLSGDAGDLPFYGWKRMAHSGFTLLSLPFSLSLIPLNWGPLLASAELPICDRWPKQWPAGLFSLAGHCKVCLLYTSDAADE